jgi:subtilase family serine protease
MSTFHLRRCELQVPFILVMPLVAALAIAACNAGGTSNVPAASGISQSNALTYHVVPDWMSQHQARATCPQVTGRPTCLALEVLKNGVKPLCSPSACGWTPAQLEAAYSISGQLGNGSGKTVALIEAGDYSAATSDLGVYRTQFGLGTGSLKRYNSSGQQSNYPPSCVNYGWCIETALDMDMVSASCPKCNIYIMEAADTIADFEKAEAEAVTLGATVMSNSWICYGSYDCGDTNFGNYFNTPGKAYLASSGDASYDNIGGPSVLSTVIAVGGTQLGKSGSKYTESVWNGAGAGCSSPTEVGGSGVAKPSWQHDPDCTYRTDADVSAESGCSPGVSEYDSIDGGGWLGVCGTSVASPFSAGIIQLKGNAATIGSGKHFWTLRARPLRRGIIKVLTGNDGSCSGEYLCTAGTNQFHQYSGPGGWGAPHTDSDF